MKVALTGSISSGKSTAMSMFAVRGAAVLGTDVVVHELLEDEEVRLRVTTELGLEKIASGEAGRRELAAVVFSDETKLQRLQQLLFPLVQQKVDAWFRLQAQENTKLAVVEVPMLLEAGMEPMFDHVILITAPEAVRRDRRGRRLDTEDFERRDARQTPDAEKKRFCHLVYENTGSLKDLEAFVDGAIELVSGGG